MTRLLCLRIREGTIVASTRTALTPSPTNSGLHAPRHVKGRWRTRRPLVLLALFLSIWAGGSIRAYGPAVGSEAGAQQPARLAVSPDNDSALGSANAPVTIVEFGDFLCPYCAQFHQQTLPALLAAYPDQIRYVYRDFPIMGAASVRAAQAAACAGQQGRYWEYHGALFERFPGLEVASLVGVARSLGLDAIPFEACLTTGRYASEVQEDLASGLALRINGTPTFFVNGRPLAGAQPVAVFQRIIDEELPRPKSGT